jgi:hypothetical protein
MNIEKFETTIKGITPLILHNCQMSNPLNKYNKQAKVYSSKGKKTEEDLEKLLNIQWESALYWSDELGLYMPWENIYSCILKAAKNHSMGQKMGGVSFSSPIGYPIITKNHKNLKLLKKDNENKFVKMVSIRRSKVLSCRPIFNEWEISFKFNMDTRFINANDMKIILTTMKERGGLGVWRPTSPQPGPYGRFVFSHFVHIDSDNKKTELKV